MSEERIEYLTNRMYYHYLDADEAKEYLTYINNLQQENTQLKSVLKEIRKYIKEKQKIQYKFALSRIECNDILEIIDKGIGEDK